MAALLNAGSLIATHARIRPDKVGAQDSTRALTFREWNERACRLANGLMELGLLKGDRVALLAYNCVEWMEIYVALAKAGLVAVPLNFRLTPPEIRSIIEDCGAAGVIVQDVLADRFDALRADLRISPERYVHFGGKSGLAPDGYQAYEAIIASAPSHETGVDVRPEDVWALMYTSGTTGKAKGAVRTHEGSALISLVTDVDLGFGPDDRGLLVMPMCHANSLYVSFSFAYCGATCVIHDRKSFDAEEVLRTLSEQKITFTSLVPTQYIMILDLPAEVRGRYSTDCVQKLFISSAPARRDTKVAIMEFFRNSQLFEMYGSTEAGWVTILRPDEQLTKLGSIGREWTGTGPVRLLDDEGRDVSDGEVGELYSRTPFCFREYWNNPAKTKEAFRGEWCTVGDMAYRDPDGYFFLVDRKSNMIISGGENVYPTEIETLLAAHPKIRESAVIGLPHEKWGESVHAVIVLKDGTAATEDEILAWCKDRIAGYKRPRSLSFIRDDEMPRTATGKLQHKKLRDRFGGAEVKP